MSDAADVEPKAVPAPAEAEATEDATGTPTKDDASADARSPDSKEDGEGENPLVMDEGGPRTKTSKKKKGTSQAATQQTAAVTKTTALDLINARLAELGRAQPEKAAADAEAEAPQEPQATPHQLALNAYEEGGEAALREYIQKSVQLQKKSDREVLLLKRKTEAISKEKERIQVESVEAKADQQRIQIKCLELQKQIKALREAAQKMDEEKEQQRSELETKFQTAIDEITAKLQDGGKDRGDLKKENDDLAAKVKKIEDEWNSKFDEYQALHDEKSDTLVKAKDVLAVDEQTAKQEREKNELLENSLRLTMRSCLELKEQIKMYSERMSEFEGSITKSKEVFGTFGAKLTEMKEHCDLLQKTRDQAKEELAALDKRFVEFNDEKNKLRKQINQQTQTNTKQKEAAGKLNNRRAAWKPYIPEVTKWVQEQKRAEGEERAQHVDPVPAAEGS